MAVYKRSYSSYAGPVTSPVTRVLVLTRYGLAEAWASKITVGLFTLCWLPCLLSIFGIYLANNPLARAMIAGRGGEMLTINANYFLKVLSGQCWLALVLAAWVAPRLITFDLADNALPILLSHPISRVGYFCGKFLALFASLSAVTWGQCLLLFAYQGYASPTPWALNHLRIAAGLVAGAVIWIAFLSVLGLALSSWVKWRVVATGTIFAAVFIPAGVGAIASAVLRTRWGFLLNIPFMITSLWQRMLGAEAPVNARFSIPTSAIITMLTIGCAVCLWMLHTRIRAREVVRG